MALKKAIQSPFDGTTLTDAYHKLAKISNNILAGKTTAIILVFRLDQ